MQGTNTVSAIASEEPRNVVDIDRMIRERIAKPSENYEYFPLCLIMAITNFRFSKHYRWGSTAYHKAVFACLDTVYANLYADRILAGPRPYIGPRD